jgi:hypothetical protein
MVSSETRAGKIGLKSKYMNVFEFLWEGRSTAVEGVKIKCTLSQLIFHQVFIAENNFFSIYLLKKKSHVSLHIIII